MAFVAATRLRVRAWRYLPGFLIAAFRSAQQARRAKGSLALTVLRDAHNTFWTCSVWTDEAAMKAFIVSGAHRAAMPRLIEWCDEASVADWRQASAEAPSWEEVYRRMQRDGRISEVAHPSEAQRRFEIPAPKLRRSRALRLK